jgi:DNA-binding GntR family transcriptional regulator
LEPARPLKTPSITDAVASHIRQLIVDGKLPPGPLPSIESFAATLDVSVTPVREAMKRLQFEGLVEIRPRSGVYVRYISPTEVRDVSALKEVLEPLEARWAAERASPEEKQALLVICQRLVAAAEDDDFDAYSSGTEERSAALVSMTHSPLLDSVFLAMESRVRPVRYRSIASTGRFRAAAAEHYAIAEAIADGDADKAADLAQFHVLQARINLSRYADAAGDQAPAAPHIPGQQQRQASGKPRRGRSAAEVRGRSAAEADASSQAILAGEGGPD